MGGGVEGRRISVRGGNPHVFFYVGKHFILRTGGGGEPIGELGKVKKGWEKKNRAGPGGGGKKQKKNR